MTGLQKRIVSAAILLPVAVAALWFGDRAWAGLIFIFAVVMAWEWCAICAARRSTQVAWPAGRLTPVSLVALLTTVVALLPALVPIGFYWPPAWMTLIIGAVLTMIAAWPRHRLAALWFGLGLLYVVPASFAALTIRAQSGDGFATEIWIVALVVAADTGAYIAGRSIGGPKLAPRISPSKTWAGLAGAVFSAGLVGCVTAQIVAPHAILSLVVLSGFLGVVEQAGDLFESFLKRHFGVKDSGRIIPGHGGILDRVDGLLAVILTIAGFEFLVGGGIFAWL
jgi:phosphatidate cytidylyltransferase